MHTSPEQSQMASKIDSWNLIFLLKHRYMQPQLVNNVDTEKQSKIEKIKAELAELLEQESLLKSDNAGRQLIIKEHQVKIDENDQELNYISQARKLKEDRIKSLGGSSIVEISSSALKRLENIDNIRDDDPNLVPTTSQESCSEEYEENSEIKKKLVKPTKNKSNAAKTKSKKEKDSEINSDYDDGKEKIVRSRSAKYRHEPFKIDPDIDRNYVGGFLKRYCKRTVYITKVQAVLADEKAHARCGKLRDLYIRYLKEMKVFQNVPYGGQRFNGDLKKLGIKQERFGDGPVYLDLYCEETSRIPNKSDDEKA